MNTNQEQQANPGLYDLASPADASIAMEEVTQQLEQFPIYGVEDFKKGVAVRGKFLGNQTRGADKDGKVRTIHALQNLKSGAKFGIWERPTTSRAFQSLAVGTVVDVIYEGQADKHPTDPKKSAPHMFKILKAKA